MTMAPSSLSASPRPATAARRLSLQWLLALMMLASTTLPSSHAFLFPRPTTSARPVATSTSTTRHQHQHQPPSSRGGCPSLIALPPCHSKRTTRTALKYASKASASSDGGPMSEVDSSKGGGCPFLDTSYVYKTYAVPALFSAKGMLCFCCLVHNVLGIPILVDTSHGGLSQILMNNFLLFPPITFICLTLRCFRCSRVIISRLKTNRTLRRRMQPLQQIRTNPPTIRFLQR